MVSIFKCSSSCLKFEPIANWKWNECRSRILISFHINGLWYIWHHVLCMRICMESWRQCITIHLFYGYFFCSFTLISQCKRNFIFQLSQISCTDINAQGQTSSNYHIMVYSYHPTPNQGSFVKFIQRFFCQLKITTKSWKDLFLYSPLSLSLSSHPIAVFLPLQWQTPACHSASCSLKIACFIFILFYLHNMFIWCTVLGREMLSHIMHSSFALTRSEDGFLIPLIFLTVNGRYTQQPSLRVVFHEKFNDWNIFKP